MRRVWLPGPFLVAFVSATASSACLTINLPPDSAAAPSGTIAMRGAPSTVAPQSGATLNVPLPFDAQPGDFLWAVVTETGPAFAVDPGWTQYGHVHDCHSTGLTTYWLGRVAGASEPPSYRFDLGGVTTASAILVSFTGVEPSNPVDVTSNPVLLPGVPYAAPSVTTTSPNDLLLIGYASADGSGAQWTVPDGMTLLASTGNLAVFDSPVPVAGPTLEKKSSPGVNGSCGALDVFALRPAQGH